jgi:pimeloyl-ACP methyl ester carboxylesterase
MVGNCSGAVVGLVAAEMAPARIHRVVLIDAFAFMPWYFRVFVPPVVGEVAYRSTFANPVGRWATNVSLRHRRQAETHLTDFFRDIDPQVSLRYLRLLQAIPDVSRFAAVNAAVDLLHGANTFTAVKDSVAMWQRLWPQARTWRIEGAGHLPLEEVPSAVADILFERSAASCRVARS